MKCIKKSQINWKKQIEYNSDCVDKICTVPDNGEELNGSDFYLLRLAEVMEAYRERTIYIKSLEFELTGKIQFYNNK